MIVVLDLGNSRVKAGYPSPRGWRHEVWPNTPAGFRRCAVRVKRWRPASIGLVSVVPRLNGALVREIRRRVGLTPQVIRLSDRGGMAVRYRQPFQLGMDRYVNAVGAWREYGGPCVIVDIGTAVTVDAVSARGVLLGGAILPGPFLMLKVLHREAAQLPQAKLGLSRRVIGRSTTECLRSGVGYGVIGAIETLAIRMKREMGGRPTVLLTGGGAPLLRRHLTGVTHYDPHLTLKGAAWLMKSRRTVTSSES